jgi:hypothetical protein
MSDSQDADAMPSDDELDKPSTENDPGEEPKAPESVKNDVPAPTHHATGIGVIDD